MLYRVRNEANQHYGGRGITVCKRWHKFENFLADMGERPEGKTLDRIDNSKGYSKPNCRWATQKEQCNNRRSSVHPTHNGKTQSLGEWSKELGIKYATLAYRWRKHKKLIL